MARDTRNSSLGSAALPAGTHTSTAPPGTPRYFPLGTIGPDHFVRPKTLRGRHPRSTVTLRFGSPCADHIAAQQDPAPRHRHTTPSHHASPDPPPVHPPGWSPPHIAETGARDLHRSAASRGESPRWNTLPQRRFQRPAQRVFPAWSAHRRPPPQSIALVVDRRNAVVVQGIDAARIRTSAAWRNYPLNRVQDIEECSKRPRGCEAALAAARVAAEREAVLRSLRANRFRIPCCVEALRSGRGG